MSFEQIPTKEKFILYRRASNTEEDINALIVVEQSVSGQSTYSPMLTKEEWVEELKNNEIFFIEDDQKQIVGNINLHKNNREGTLDGLVVMPEFQGQGFARKALEYALKTVLADCTTINLFVHPNGPARKLYESLGFLVSQELENYFGDGEPRLEMILKR